MTQSTDSEAAVDAAIAAFADGQPVLIHDFADREGETDIVYPATAVDSDAVARLRNDAGGLICVALSDAVSDAFGLPFLQELVDHPAAADHELAYDERSSFSLTVNHRETFTGITDVDRALTISELGTAAAAVTADAGYDESDFAAAFSDPRPRPSAPGRPGAVGRPRGPHRTRDRTRGRSGPTAGGRRL